MKKSFLFVLLGIVCATAQVNYGNQQQFGVDNSENTKPWHLSNNNNNQPIQRLQPHMMQGPRAATGDVGFAVGQPGLDNQALLMQVQLLSYSNPSRTLPNNKICYDNNALPPPPMDARHRRFKRQRQSCAQARQYAMVNGALGTFLPTCNPDGSYAPLQCAGSTGFCWCADRYGNEVPNTKTGPGKPRPNCASMSGNNANGMPSYDNTPQNPYVQTGGGGSNYQPRSTNEPGAEDCQLTFIATVSSSRDPQHSLASLEPQQLTEDKTNVAISQDTAWTRTWQIPMKQKPDSIDITVLHTGNIRYANGSWPFRNARYTVVMDTFTVNLTNVRPDPSNVMGHTNVQVTGNDLKTSLSLSFGFQCFNNMAGDNCDLVCNDNGITVCRSIVNNRESVCRSRVGNTVSGCTECLLGIHTDQNNNIECRTEHNGGETKIYYGVATGYRTATIIFGIILILMIIVMLITCCLALLKSRRAERHPGWAKFPYRRTSSKDNSMVKGRVPPTVAPKPQRPGDWPPQQRLPPVQSAGPNYQGGRPAAVRAPLASDHNGSIHLSDATDTSFQQNGHLLGNRREAAV